MDPNRWQIERRHDGALLVRVRSSGSDGCQHPDAVFAFRLGDPQYMFWEQRLRDQELARR